MGLFGNLVKKLVKKDYSLEAKEKCDFCDELFQKKPIKVITFSFTGDIQYQCCEKCFRKASKNEMKITSPKILKDYIAKEHIEYAADPRLKNFFGSQIYIDGLWLTINNSIFFSRSDIGLPFNSNDKTTNVSPSSNNDRHSDDNSCFWTSYVVADLMHSPIAGYLVGGSFFGALLGSNASSNADSFSSFNSSVNNPSSSSIQDDSFSSPSCNSDSSSSCSSWGDSGSDSSSSSFSDSGSSCGGGD